MLDVSFDSSTPPEIDSPSFNLKHLRHPSLASAMLHRPREPVNDEDFCRGEPEAPEARH
jgi:hypothetical protein